MKDVIEEKQYTDEELEILFEEIRSGERCVIVDGRIFLFKYPPRTVISQCVRMEKVIRDKYKTFIPDLSSLPTFFSGVTTTMDLDFWESEKHKLEQVLEHNDIKTNAESNAFYTKRYKQACAKIESIKRVKEKTERLDLFTLDRRIKDLIFQFLIKNQTYLLTDNQEIKFFDRVSTRRSIHWYRLLARDFIDFYYGPNEQVVRRVARLSKVSSLWRVSCNTGSSFFSGSTSDYTPVQTKLCFWLSYYTDVFKNLGSPDSDKIYHDDKQFDQWVRGKIDEIKSRASDAGRGSKGGQGDVSRHKIRFKNPTRASGPRLG